MEGRILWFDDFKKFGFIECNGEQYFVHVDNILRHYKTLNEGETVTFDLINEGSGIQAGRVRVDEHQNIQRIQICRAKYPENQESTSHLSAANN